MATYKHRTNPANPRDYKGGYKDEFLFCPVGDFATIAAPGAAAAIGDKVKITTAHTFTGTNGFFSWETKYDTVLVTSETVGDPGAKISRWTLKFILITDDAETQEQVETQLNAKVIALIQDSKCTAGEYNQFGDECDQPAFSAAFNSHNKAEGTKEWEVTAVITGSRYFYTGAVVKSTAA